MLFTQVKATKQHPKPSVLLAKALSLFSPDGLNWITGNQKDHRDEAFLYKGQILETDDAVAKIQALLKDNPSAITTISKEFQLLSEADTFCSIGAIREINTRHQQLAEKYLAAAISTDYRKYIKIPHNDDAEECKCADCQSLDDTFCIITSNNDKLSNEPEERLASYKVIKGWFTKAIALAKADGN